jgi:hypothetical protein
MAMEIFVARTKKESLKALGVLWTNLVLLVSVLLAIASTYFGFINDRPIIGLLFSTWLILGGVFYVSLRHPYKTLHHRLQVPVAAAALASLILGVAFVKIGVAI